MYSTLLYPGHSLSSPSRRWNSGRACLTPLTIRITRIHQQPDQQFLHAGPRHRKHRPGRYRSKNCTVEPPLGLVMLIPTAPARPSALDGQAISNGAKAFKYREGENQCTYLGCFPGNQGGAEPDRDSSSPSRFWPSLFCSVSVAGPG